MRGITQRQLSAQSGIAVGTISRFLRGQPIGSDKLEQLISVLPEFSLEWLFRGTGTVNLDDNASDQKVQIQDSSLVEVARQIIELLKQINSNLARQN